MATLAAGGRITAEIVEEEIARLRASWATGRHDVEEDTLAARLPDDALAAIDPFDRVQLATVVRVCPQALSLSDAGRRLFSASRARKAAPDDADRLRKYFARFGLDWHRLQQRADGG